MNKEKPYAAVNRKGQSMTQEEMVVMMIKGAIEELPSAEREQCKELAEQIRHMRKAAGDPVGSMAIVLVGAELAAEQQ